MRLLTVEDDQNFTESLLTVLSRHFHCDHAATIKQAISLGQQNPYDIAVIDLGLPDGDGQILISELRHTSPKLPILVLTGATIGSEELLNMGADDFVRKPFACEDLIARLHALMRRRSTYNQSCLACGSIQLCTISRTASYCENPLKLRRKEFDILELLLRKQTQVVSREEILEHIWSGTANSFTKAVDVHVMHLRQKMSKGGKMIESVYGHGYRLSDSLPTEGRWEQ